jgi:FixJ family two-component response regulator
MRLAISRSIIEAHLGVLWAAPNQPHGSIFQFTMPPGHHAPGSSCPRVTKPPGHHAPGSPCPRVTMPGAAERVGAMMPGDPGEPTVVVIDDDVEIRDALQSLLRSVGFQVELFASVQDYLGNGQLDRPGCLILDVRLPGRSGLDFLDDLTKANAHVPVIFISGVADVPMSVRAMKAGAVEFLTKPVRHQDLLEAVQSAVERDHVRRSGEQAAVALQATFETLSPREREVMTRVVAGRLNKVIAGELNLTEATVKVHRAQVMRKMGARSLADLIRMADRLTLPPPGPRSSTTKV